MTQSPRPAYVSSLLLLFPIFLLPYTVIFFIVVSFVLFLHFRNLPSPANNVTNFFRAFHLGGHRGSPTNAPENTIASFKQALAEGVDFIEFDLGLTADGVPVLMHDHTLERTTNMTGLLRDYNFPDLVAQCDCGAKFKRVSDPQLQQNGTANGGQSERVPICSLKEVVEWATKNNVKMILDVKDSDYELVIKIEELFEEYNLFDRAIVCSFFPWIIYWIKRRNSHILTGFTFRRRNISYTDLKMTIPRFSSPFYHCSAVALDALYRWSIKVCLPHFLGVDMLLIERGEICENFVSEMADQGFHMCVWTVNDKNEMAWIAHKLKIPFLTDFPHKARAVLDGANGVPTELTFELN
ncbi:hypothetical protein niasHT_037991 [Heterodera trifolii]|uniref:GP-PDE domain-containing protein n=1 Tax=Heterodera trifolii TaxID=157864 RepID=A0ABD2HPF9_9BILA